MEKNTKIYIAGHRGLVGSALVRRLNYLGYNNLLVRTSYELDLRDQSRVDAFFQQEKPDYVLLAAARVGSIQENIRYPADFMTDNILIETNVMRASFQNGVRRLLYICSSSIYPAGLTCPSEEDLFQGPVHSSNEGYAYAKLFGLKLCELYRRQYGMEYFTVIPCNLYGKEDRFLGDSAHVIPAMIQRFHQAKTENLPSATVWGTGKAMREFLYADDFAEQCLQLLEEKDTPSYINIGSGQYITIADLAELIKKVVGYKGEILFQAKRAEGMLLRKMDLSKMQPLHLCAKTGLEEGLSNTYQFYVQNLDRLR